MAHAAKRAKSPGSVKAAKSSGVSSLKRSVAGKSVKHPLTKTTAKRTSGTSSAKRKTATVSSTKSDRRGKSHGHRSYAAHTEQAKPSGEKTTVTKKASAKRPEVTRYGEAAKAKRSTSGVPKAAHKAKAAHLPHNGTAHHEQYKK